MAIKKFDGTLAVGQWVLMDSRLYGYAVSLPVKVTKVTDKSFFFMKPDDTIPSHRSNARVQFVADTEAEAIDFFKKTDDACRRHRLEVEQLTKLHRANLGELVAKLCAR